MSHPTMHGISSHVKGILLRHVQSGRCMAVGAPAASGDLPPPQIAMSLAASGNRSPPTPASLIPVPRSEASTSEAR